MNPYPLNDEAQFTPMSNVEMQSSNPFENQYQYKTEVELQPLMQTEEQPMVDFKTVINTIRIARIQLKNMDIQSIPKN